MRYTALAILAACFCLMSAPARADGPRTGAFSVSFTHPTPLADAADVVKRLLHPLVYKQWQAEGRVQAGQTIVPSQESWHVYVPPEYDGSEPYGVIVWVSPDDDGSLEENWQHSLRVHKLIYIGADRSGNTQSVVTRRVPLALTGLANIEAQYKVDPTRVYISGFSGGGVTASRMAAAYADVFTGGLFVSTSDGLGSGDVPVPPLERFELMRSRGRYVFTIGNEETSNLIMNVRAVAEYRALCVPRVDFIRIPNRTHSNIDPRYFEKAVQFLDHPPEVDAPAQADCEKQLAARRSQGFDEVRQAFAAGDKDKAWDLLQDLYVVYGPLAEPDFSHYAGCLNGKTLSTDCLVKPTGGS